MGVLVDDAVDVHHNLIYRNTESGSGVGILVDSGNGSTISNNTIYTPAGHGIHLQSNTRETALRNNIIWTESGYDLRVETDSQVGFSSDYNNLFATGTGKLVYWQKDFVDLFDWQVEADFDNHSIGFAAPSPRLDNPQFVNLAGDDYHLTDAASTSIDAGDPAGPLGNEPVPRGGQTHLGAYGNTTVAALSRAAFVEVDAPNFYDDLQADVGQPHSGIRST